MTIIYLASISIELGKGALKHNSRIFNTPNTNPERSHLNKEYINDDIKNVYHKLFDEPNNIQNILNAYINRKTEKHFTALVKQKDIENADYNLSVSTYVESEDTREAIDIAVLNKQISEIVQRENTLRAEIDAIIAEIEEA